MIAFILVGLELPHVVQIQREHRITALAGEAALESMTVIGMQLAP